MKFPGEAAERIARLLLSDGPATARELAELLGMSSTAVRRPLLALCEAGLVAQTGQPPYGPSRAVRRGRPSQIFSLTDEGRSACDQGYDGLALEALRYLRDTGDANAVEGFAKARARRLLGVREDGSVSSSGQPDPESLAALLTIAGFAATFEPNEAGSHQLCQHNCPVVEAAKEFPELCDAETEVLSEILGLHVTRLATLAQGGHVCTTLIPKENIHRNATRKVSA
ncbi:MAG: winged helix-turn-helix transcriptional regulator [Candidatus Nanopelagicales bacterium]|jgi:predicted ArsR family transcriptional regulator|nr:winged helix-turn-helix transcriptional regulator [Candidatus Nanopelagicales bacterium]